MKRVSFEVAKALKEAGYPQRIDKYVYLETGPLVPYSDYYSLYFSAPTYLEIWLWLWREKKIYFGIESESYPHEGTCLNDYQDIPYLDPEEAISEAIEYLVENNLIK